MLCYLQPIVIADTKRPVFVLFSSLECCRAALLAPPAAPASSQQATRAATRPPLERATWLGGNLIAFEQHCCQLDTNLGSEADAIRVLEHWDNSLMTPAAHLQPAPAGHPCAWRVAVSVHYYVSVYDRRVMPLQLSQRLVLAHAGHTLAESLVIVEQANHSRLFSPPITVQREVARLCQGCFAPVPPR